MAHNLNIPHNSVSCGLIDDEQLESDDDKQSGPDAKKKKSGEGVEQYEHLKKTTKKPHWIFSSSCSD